MKIDLSLTNAALYAGCEIEEVAGRSNLKTPVKDAVNLVGRNIGKMLCDDPPFVDEKGNCPYINRDEITLTGPMAVWSYLVVFHAVVHRFSKVWYDDGRSGAVLVAAHG